jgi:hypothetical protein
MNCYILGWILHSLLRNECTQFHSSLIFISYKEIVKLSLPLMEGLCLADRQMQRSHCNIVILTVIFHFHAIFIICTIFCFVYCPPFTISYGFPHLFVSRYNRFSPFPALIIVTQKKKVVGLNRGALSLTIRVNSSPSRTAPSFLCIL